MKFVAEPNLFVRFSNKYVQRVTSMKGIHFDDKGEYNTDSEVLIKLLSQHFKHEESSLVEPDQESDEAIREKGKQLKIKSWHIMSIETLKSKIEEIEGVQ